MANTHIFALKFAAALPACREMPPGRTLTVVASGPNQLCYADLNEYEKIDTKDYWLLCKSNIARKR